MIDRNSTRGLHFYMSWGCPFCHRVLAGLYLNGLQDLFSFTWVKTIKREKGWEIEPGDDPAFGAKCMRDIYDTLDPGGNHRPAVPLLIDVETKSIVSTSSADMLRWISSGFNGSHDVRHKLAPQNLRADIDALNSQLHDSLNRAVYTVGQAREQSDYETQVRRLFDALDIMESRLNDRTYLFGDDLTESDIFLFATLLRFDAVYVPLFRCSLKRIADYPALNRYMLKLLEIPEMKDTARMDVIKNHYFQSLIQNAQGSFDPNPSGIVPLGPDIGLGY